MTTKSKIQWLLRLTAGAAILAVATGCSTQSDDGLIHGEQFVPNDVERSTDAFNNLEAANAAHADATMRSYHFDGEMLNSLGEERLDLILRNGDTPAPLVIFIDLPKDDEKTAHRRDAVMAYLKDRGLADNQIVMKSGPNPDVNSPVAPLLAAQGGATSSAPPAGPTQSATTGH
ncbi:MAG TPA: hypothetical protein VFE47_10945 [Tepidisphaeraceae bacterium]|jgi:hypothetical protein|nr:hypothetical protein [Tepidisphaeraceae bacterium]